MKRLRSLYPAQTGPENTEYPYGSFRNKQFDGDPAGTPLEVAWANDIQGFFVGLLKRAGITANNLAETANNSQLATAVDTIAQNFVRKSSFSWPDTSNPGIGASNEVYRLVPLWGGGTGTNFVPSAGLLRQDKRTASSDWYADLIQPPGRWQIMSLGASVEDFDNSPSISPFKISLVRYATNGLTSPVTIGTLQWGNGGSGSDGATVNISGIATYYMSGNQQYGYYIHVEGEEDVVEGTPSTLPKVRSCYVILKFVPF